MHQNRRKKVKSSHHNLIKSNVQQNLKDYSAKSTHCLMELSDVQWNRMKENSIYVKGFKK